MRKLAVFALLLVVSCQQAHHPSPREDARRIVELTISEQSFSNMFVGMRDLLTMGLQKEAQDSNRRLSDEVAGYYADLLSAEMSNRMARQMTEGYVDLYLQTFSSETLRAYRQFLETEEGAAYAAAQPDFISSAVTLGEDLGAVIGTQAAQAVNERILNEDWPEGGDAKVQATLKAYLVGEEETSGRPNE